MGIILGMTRDSGTPISAFLSYAHATEDEYGLIEPLSLSLVNQVKARANRDLKIWKDTDDIPWGSQWRDAIEGGIKGASVLFVLATQHYLDSEACRQEFNDFLQAVEKTGRSELRRLILPILPIAAPGIFHEDSEDEIARVIASTQYIEIEDAVIEGPKSPAWGRAMKQLSIAFIKVVDDVERELASGSGSSAAVDSEVDVLEEEDGGPGFIDRMGQIEEEFESMQGEVVALASALDAFPAIAQESDFSSVKSARHMLTQLTLLARKLDPLSQKIGASGGVVKASAQSIDDNLRSVAKSLHEIQTEEQRQELREQLTSMASTMETANGVGDQMTSMLTSMRQVESSSAAVRKALRPFRRGISDFRDALRIMQAWGPDMLED